VLSRIRAAWVAARAPIRRPPVINPGLYHLTKVLLLPLLYGPLRMRRTGHRQIPRRGATIVVCNHVSFFDPIIIGAAIRPRRAYLMAKSELFRSSFLAWWMSRCGAFPVQRATADRESIRTARQLLEAGHCLVLFPEGGVTRTGVMRPGFPGSGALALLPDVTVIPAVVWNTQMLKGPVRVRFGAPIPMQDLRDGPKAGRNQRATERIMAHLAALLPMVGGPVQAPPTGEPWVPAPRADGRGVIRS
jgi:1-acyl-sn-glycerol-3-phosphate acyltransferase